MLAHLELRIVSVQEDDAQELCAPLQFFVEVGSYAKVTGSAPCEGSVITKKFQGQTLAGAT